MSQRAKEISERIQGFSDNVIAFVESLSEDDWRSIQETMYLLNIPVMRESIREGLATPVEDCKEELDW